MSVLIDWTLPIVTISEANTYGHWSQRYQRAKKQKAYIYYHWRKVNPTVPLPCKVTFSRLSPRMLDSDNLPVAFKAIRDELADLIIPGLAAGQADADPRISWHYDQTRSKFKGIRILIEST